MTAAAGTIENVAIELSKLLRPLARDLAPGRTKMFFHQMGITLTDAQAAAVGGPLGITANRTSAMLPKIGQMIDAIVAENYGQIAALSLDVIQDIADIIQSLDAVGSNIAGATTLSADEVTKRIFDYLTFQYLEAARGLNDVFEILGLLEREDQNQDSIDPNNPPFTIATYHFDRIGDWFSNPLGQLRALYGWGGDFDGHALFAKIESIAVRNNLPVIYDETAPVAKLDLVIFEATPNTAVSPRGLSILLKSKIATGTLTIPLGADAKLDIKADFQPPFNTGIDIQPDGTINFHPPSPGPAFSGDFLLKLTARKTEPPEPFILFGAAGGSRLELLEFILTTGANVTWSGGGASGDFMIGAVANALKVIIDTTNSDGFLAKILPDTKVEADFDIQMGISTERGFYFSGSSALEVRLPTHIELGPVELQALTIRAALEGGKIPVSVGADIRAELGPVVAVVQNMGVRATFSFPPDNRGNLGPLRFALDFKPPDGVGLSIDAGVIKGGGFLHLDFEKGEYFGALEFSFKNIITLKAVGIINTKMPDGSKGFALLILITAEFTPIQLGFGFTLVGVGGLLALNRTLDTEALRAGVRTGAVSSILFPQDVVANIGRIISDLKTIFPIAQDHFIIGPMGKFGWGTPTLITLEVGFILDIPQPQFTIIGVLRCILPSEDAAILQLQVNFAGGIDFDRGLIWFDASLFDSRLLIYTLTGDMALRIGWGERAVFVVSVGGFHPAFQEIPPDLRSMRRLSISLMSGDNPRLTAQSYFAVTSNTVQSGSRVELYAAACGFNIYGFLGYDLLVQFSPFYFIADIYAGLALRDGDDVLFGINVHCQLSGPTPWHARGEASFEILFFEVTIDFDVTWGDEGPAQIEQTVDVLPLIHTALLDDRNWTATFPENTHPAVTLKKIEQPPTRIVLHPVNVLAVSQKVAPLGMEINKFGNQRPTGDTRFELSFGGGSTEELREEFAVANFLKLSDSDKLSRKSFEKLRSGLRFATGDSSQYGANAEKAVSYELSYVHRKKRLTIKAGLYKLFGGVFATLAKGGSIGKNTYAVAKRKPGTPPEEILVNEPSYLVVNANDLSLHAPDMTAGTSTEAYQLQAQLLAADPSLKGKVLVISSQELN